MSCEAAAPLNVLQINTSNSSGQRITDVPAPPVAAKQNSVTYHCGNAAVSCKSTETGGGCHGNVSSPLSLPSTPFPENTTALSGGRSLVYPLQNTSGVGRGGSCNFAAAYASQARGSCSRLTRTVSTDSTAPPCFGRLEGNNRTTYQGNNTRHATLRRTNTVGQQQPDSSRFHGRRTWTAHHWDSHRADGLDSSSCHDFPRDNGLTLQRQSDENGGDWSCTAPQYQRTFSSCISGRGSGDRAMPPRGVLGHPADRGKQLHKFPASGRKRSNSEYSSGKSRTCDIAQLPPAEDVQLCEEVRNGTNGVRLPNLSRRFSQTAPYGRLHDGNGDLNCFSSPSTIHGPIWTRRPQHYHSHNHLQHNHHHGNRFVGDSVQEWAGSCCPTGETQQQFIPPGPVSQGEQAVIANGLPYTLPPPPRYRPPGRGNGSLSSDRHEKQFSPKHHPTGIWREHCTVNDVPHHEGMFSQHREVLGEQQEHMDDDSLMPIECSTSTSISSGYIPVTSYGRSTIADGRNSTASSEFSTTNTACYGNDVPERLIQMFTSINQTQLAASVWSQTYTD